MVGEKYIYLIHFLYGFNKDILAKDVNGIKGNIYLLNIQSITIKEM